MTCLWKREGTECWEDSQLHCHAISLKYRARLKSLSYDAWCTPHSVESKAYLFQSAVADTE